MNYLIPLYLLDFLDHLEAMEVEAIQRQEAKEEGGVNLQTSQIHRVS